MTKLKATIAPEHEAFYYELYRIVGFNDNKVLKFLMDHAVVTLGNFNEQFEIRKSDEGEDNADVQVSLQEDGQGSGSDKIIQGMGQAAQ